jgi:hypothetical protein
MQISINKAFKVFWYSAYKYMYVGNDNKCYFVFIK